MPAIAMKKRTREDRGNQDSQATDFRSLLLPEQHDGPKKEGRRPRQRQHSGCSDLEFQNEEDEGQQDQEDADEIDRQGPNGEQGQEQANGADHPGKNDPRVGQFK